MIYIFSGESIEGLYFRLVERNSERGQQYTNTPRVFHVETTWKRPFPRLSTWNTRGVFVGIIL